MITTYSLTLEGRKELFDEVWLVSSGRVRENMLEGAAILDFENEAEACMEGAGQFEIHSRFTLKRRPATIDCDPTWFTVHTYSNDGRLISG